MHPKGSTDWTLRALFDSTGWTLRAFEPGSLDFGSRTAALGPKHGIFILGHFCTGQTYSSIMRQRGSSTAVVYGTVLREVHVVIVLDMAMKYPGK